MEHRLFMTKELSYRIRLAIDADMPLIADVHQASINEIGHGFYSDDAMRFWGRKRDPEGYRKARDHEHEVYYVAEPTQQTGLIYGFSSYKFEGGKHRLQGMYVRGTAARNGVGRALLKIVERHALGAGATELHVEASLPGETFYIVNGFRELSRHDKPVVDTNSFMTAIVMVKSIRL